MRNRSVIALLASSAAWAAVVILVAACSPPPAPTIGSGPASQPSASSPADGARAAAAGQALADTHLTQWKLQNPERAGDWVAEEKERHAIKPPFDNTFLLEGGSGVGQTYAQFSEADLQLWARETEKLVVEGSRIFHSADALGSTVGVSCDMCHPDAANTHPETYPKFQAQLGRAILLRDMINWCIQQPVRGVRLDDGSANLRALEAYIYAQRAGTPLAYGRH